jgi:glycosyltransferase involved in cell wall biosynthesis
MASVVIAAHNEAVVLGRCLDAVLDDARPGEFEVIVVAHDCTDRTADVARARAGVHVLEIERSSKAAALNCADAVATGYPRLYLDADVLIDTHGVRALCAVLEGPSAPLVAVPSRRLELGDRPLVVRGYYAIQRRLPSFEAALFGRGLLALSRAGRETFTVFPDGIADDLYLDSLFGTAGRLPVPHVTTSVAAPTRTGDLIRRLVQARRGNAALRSANVSSTLAVRPSDRWSRLTDVVLRRPWLVPAAALYVAVTAWAAILAHRPTPLPRVREAGAVLSGGFTDPTLPAGVPGRRVDVVGHRDVPLSKASTRAA